MADQASGYDSLGAVDPNQEKSRTGRHLPTAVFTIQEALLDYDGRMSLWRWERIAEPEAMDEPEDVEAYASAASEDYLDRMDSACAESILRVGARTNWWLDVGCGPGQIDARLAGRTPAKVVGIDLLCIVTVAYKMWFLVRAKKL